MILLISTFVIFILLLTIILKKRYYRLDPQPPIMSGHLPLIGHAYRLYGNSEHMFEIVQEITERCIAGGDTVRVLLGIQSYYVLSDVDDILTVNNACLDKNFMYGFTKPWIGDGLLCAPGAKWKPHRKLLNPAFNQQVLNEFLPIFNNNARRVLNQFALEERNVPFYPDKHIMRSSLETIFQTATGIDLSADKATNDRFVKATDNVLQTVVTRVQNIWYYNNFIWNLTSVKKRQDVDIKFLHSITERIVKIRKEKSNGTLQDCNANGKTKSFSDMFFDLEQPDGKGVFTDQDVMDHVNTLIVAGYDTVASSLLYIILLIGSHPEVQDKMYTELQEVFENSNRDVEKLDLARLNYMEAVIKESLRLYPVGPITARVLDKDVKIKNYTLKSDKTCFLLINGINRHPNLWVDPNQFKPERWLSPETLPLNPNAFATFNIGRRNCIGRIYAMMWLKTYLSHMLRKYIITSDMEKVVFKFDIITKISSGHHISIQNRTLNENQ